MIKTTVYIVILVLVVTRCELYTQTSNNKVDSVPHMYM